MSLIDEALKRAQEASRREAGASEGRPWAPAPLPDAGLARRRKLLRAASWAAIALVAAAAGFALLRRGSRVAGTPRDDSGRTAIGPAPAPATPVTATQEPEPAPERVQPRASRPAAAEPAPAERSAEVEPAERPPVAVAPRALADGRTYVGAVDLPGGGRLELGGIVWSEEEPRALLNDRIVATDGYIEGFTVERIEEDRVVLERDGLRIYLSLK